MNNLKNYDHVDSQDFETYMQKGIIEFWATVNTLKENELLMDLCKKYNYTRMTTTWSNVYETVKNGATFTDLTKQIEELEQ